MKTGESRVLNRKLPYTILMSSAFWCIFEIINVRIANWFYINLPQEIEIRYLGYFFAYGTVIPGIMLLRDLFNLVFRIEIRREVLIIRNYPIYAISLGTTTFFLTLFFPEYFFPFTWIFLFLVMDGINYKKGYGSIFSEVEKGEYGNLVSTMISGFVCGILWEFWNYWAIAKWVYTVPFFDRLKVFEMPLLGYLGFSLFALEVLSFVNFIEGLGKERRKILILLAFIVFIVAFPLIDRYTVFSYRTKIDELYFLGKGKLEHLKSKRVMSSYGIDESFLTIEERQKMELLHLYGMGIENLKKLENHGINSIDELAMLDERNFSLITGEKNLRRVKIYLNTARRVKNSSRDF
ncbi:MAG: hypothetical protein N2513_08005 [Deltaproteobacteria bacterium]|nr:hypothetical protein [Deltaproteobacteria bacterium]